ncbi:hypothetical protein BDV95DRAFT_610231 [Massariosphaeria phaeospora]|uniref:Uncharacterized protein n=1 Tax=Massariosphaeria phaeospora TaxID=100035 RepID=A0A7C8I1F5_9PLEO|nr:hypothetical protein BDV95DRAFT_610231 [Massariosphaeria phaeospora]
MSLSTSSLTSTFALSMSTATWASALSVSSTSPLAPATFPKISLSTNFGLTGAGTGTGHTTNTWTNELPTSLVSAISSSVLSSTTSLLTTSSSGVFPTISLSVKSGLTGGGPGTGPGTSDVSDTTTTESPTSTFPSFVRSSDSGLTGSATGTSTVAIPTPPTSPATGPPPSATLSSSTSTSSTQGNTTALTTITSLPPGASLQSLTGSIPWSTNDWITTTKDGDDEPTVLPIIFFPVIPGRPRLPALIIWGGITPPSVKLPNLMLKLPGLPCVKFLGMKIGDCPNENNDDDPDDDPDDDSPDDPNDDTPEDTDDNTPGSPPPTGTPGTNAPSSSSSSSSCSGNTATFTTIECSSAGSSATCSTKTSETVGCSVTGSLISTGSCVASTTIASTTLCCASASVADGKTVCVFETLTQVAADPVVTATQSALGAPQLLSALSSYIYYVKGLNTRIPVETEAETTTTAASNSTSVTVSSSSGSSGSTATSLTFLTSLKTTTRASSSPSATPKPQCSEANNSLMGMNNEPASWCLCNGRGPFSTVDKATTNYCDLSALPTAIISLTSHSTSKDTACYTSTATLDTGAVQPGCHCGDIWAGIATTTTSGTTYIGCSISPSWHMLSTILPTPTPTPPTAPYAAASPGHCQVHVQQERLYKPASDKPFGLDVQIYDTGRSKIGSTAGSPYGPAKPLRMKSKLEAELVITPSSSNVTFALGTEKWSTGDVNKEALVYCNIGAYAPSDSTQKANQAFGITTTQIRHMDCYFQCPWHGGESSDKNIVLVNVE